MKLITNDTLTLKSTALNTARIGVVTGDTITGKVTVERYIAAHKAWYFLSIPTNTTQTVQQAWQEGATNTDSDLVQGYGTQITGLGGTPAGFDVYTSTPSMKRYNSATNGWTGISSTNIEDIKITDGYMVFIRGDRTVKTQISASTETVLRTKGNLFTGDQIAITVNANKFAAIGNPYASALDMRNIATSQLKEFFYLWDPYLGGTNGVGGYQTFSNNHLGDYVVIPGGGSYGARGSASNFIESGQAFLVQADSVDGSLTFNEAAKIDGGGQISRQSVLPRPQLSANLYGLNGASGTYIIDGALIDYDDSYSNGVDKMDAVKLSNGSENLSINRQTPYWS